MNLIFIILLIVLISIIFNFIPKTHKIILILTICIIIFFYYVLAKNIYCPNEFKNSTLDTTITVYDSQHIKINSRYKLLLSAILKGNIFLSTDKEFPQLQNKEIYSLYKKLATTSISLYTLCDMSYYKGKIYLYFGITPILIFYLPFYFLTNLVLSDAVVVLLCCSMIFLLTLLILRKILVENKLQIPFFIQFLSIILIGVANYSLCLLTRTEIFEIAVSSAAFLFLLAVFLLLKYIVSIKQKYIIFISLFLSLAIGCRPQYILMLPLILFVIIYVSKRYSNIKETYLSIVVFLIPCLFYGILLALYNYLRFDSIFEFGWKYQLNAYPLKNWNFNFNDLMVGLKYHLLQLPQIQLNSFPIFSTVLSQGHSIGKEFGVGVFYIFPLSLIVFILPISIKKIFCHNDKNAIFIVIMLVFSIINILVASIAGVIQRYAFEYIYILAIFSVALFYIIYNTYKFKKTFNILFVIIFIWSVYINVSLAFCMNSASYYAFSNPDFYNSIVSFLK